MVVDASMQGQAPAMALPDVADPAYSLPRRPRILVLGGGVAGLTAAYELHRQIGYRASITLIAASDRFILGPALLGVPFGRPIGRVGFALAPALARQGIAFRQGRAQRIEPEHRAVWVDGEELSYDYLLIATGPQADDDSLPGIEHGIPGANALHSLGAARETGQAMQRFLDLRILDGGDCGVLLVCADSIIPIRLALPLPGRVAHAAKRVLLRYLLWKLRTGRTYLP